MASGGISPLPGISYSKGITNGFAGVTAGTGISQTTPSTGPGVAIQTSGGVFIQTDAGTQINTSN